MNSTLRSHGYCVARSSSCSFCCRRARSVTVSWLDTISLYKNAASSSSWSCRDVFSANAHVMRIVMRDDLLPRPREREKEKKSKHRARARELPNILGLGFCHQCLCIGNYLRWREKEKEWMNATSTTTTTMATSTTTTNIIKRGMFCELEKSWWAPQKWCN